ncbi:MAG: threonine/serine exporter [Lachnospiraceae bacterium]|nr:threonine/serine exporter [Lachnospiraceae bacterium]
MPQALVQTLSACLGSAAFSVLFNIKGKKLFLIGAGGALSWIFYLLVREFSGGSALAGLFFSTIAVALLAEISARIIKTPVITLLVPMLIPLIPGGDLYRSMTFLVQNDMASFADSSKFTASEAGSIALGLLLVTTLMQIINKTLGYIHQKKKKNG